MFLTKAKISRCAFWRWASIVITPQQILTTPHSIRYVLFPPQTKPSLYDSQLREAWEIRFSLFARQPSLKTSYWESEWACLYRWKILARPSLKFPFTQQCEVELLRRICAEGTVATKPHCWDPTQFLMLWLFRYFYCNEFFHPGTSASSGEVCVREGWRKRQVFPLQGGFLKDA